MSHKDTIENMREIAEERGGKCLSSKYINNRTKLDWQCSEKHTWKATPEMVKGSEKKPGTWCPICRRKQAAKKRMHSLEEMQKLDADHSGLFISAEYLGSQIKHLWRCEFYPNHPDFKMQPGAVKNGQWCPKCGGNVKPTIEEINEFVRKKNPLAECLSEKYVNSTSNLEWHCGVKEHQTFEKSWKTVKFDGAWCKQCREEKPRPKKYSRELLVKLAEKCGGQLISNEP